MMSPPPVPLSVRPSKLHFAAIGRSFKIAGEDNRALRWTAERVPSNRGEFVSQRQVRLSNPSVGIIGGHRHAGTMTPAAGVADVQNGDTSQDGIIGAGPLVTEIALTASGADLTATEDPATGASDAAFGTNAWTNPTNILSSNDARATVTASGTTRYLKATDFGFSVAGTIAGIEVLIERSKAIVSTDSGVESGTTASSGLVGANAWTNPTNAQTSNNSYATCATAGLTHGLRVHTLGFAIPSSATILGVLSEVERKTSAIGGSTSTAATLPGSIAQGSNHLGHDNTWLNPNNALAADGAFATWFMPDEGNVGSNALRATNFGMSVPSDATILGIVLEIHRKSEHVTDGYDTYVHLVKDGSTLIGSNYATGIADYWPTSVATKSYGGAADLWGTTWTPAEVNASTFGASLEADNNYSGTTHYVDFFRITVYYSTPSPTDSTVQLVNEASALFGNNLSAGAAWPTAEAYASFGGATNMWGLTTATLTPAIINDVDFGFIVAASNPVAAPTLSVDHMRMTVYYEDGDVVDSQVRLVVDGIVVGSNRADTATQWPTADAVKTYGSPTDLWGLTTAEITATLINLSTFGVVLAATKATANGTVQVDQVRIKVYYASAASSPPTKIWDDGPDSDGTKHRYIYVGSGSRIHVIDPTSDAEVEVTAYASTVDGWDAAQWGGRWWAAPRGGATDYVQEVKVPYNGVTATNFDACDFTATALAAGPNALYRAYISGADKALVKKTTVVTQPVAATVVLTFTGQPLDTQTVVLGSKTYTFQTVLTNVDGNVKIAATAALSLTNLINAINLNAGVVGTDYATAMTVHPTVTAAEAAGDTALITARDTGTGGNSIASTETLTNGSFATATLLGGSDTITLDANWSPSSGEQMGDPGIGIIRLAVAGSHFLAGKEDGLAEFDQDFTARFYLDWMRAFQWTLQCNGILPLGASGDTIVTYRRGLWMHPRNQSIGMEQISNNTSGKRGRYTDVAFDGTWLYAALQNSDAGSADYGKAFIIKMRGRRQEGPGLFEQHPIYEREDSQIQAFWLWPGCNVNGTMYGPRLYFAVAAQTIGYIRLGETQPDQFDSNARFAPEWVVEWPHDDFGIGSSVKMPYRLEATYANASNTDGVRWEARAADTDPWQPLTADGTYEGAAVVASDGYHARYGPRDNSLRGRELSIRAVGQGGASTLQQHISGIPVLTLLEQPEMVSLLAGTLQLEASDENDDDAAAQWAKLEQLAGTGPYEIEAAYAAGAEGGERHRRLWVYVEDVHLTSTVTTSEHSGVMLADIKLRTMPFEDVGDMVAY